MPEVGEIQIPAVMDMSAVANSLDQLAEALHLAAQSLRQNPCTLCSHAPHANSVCPCGCSPFEEESTEPEMTPEEGQAFLDALKKSIE